MKPYASLPLATGLTVLAVGTSVVLSAPQAKAACIGGNNVCTTFNPSTLTQVRNVVPGGTASASAAANSQITEWGLQFALADRANQFTFPFTINNIVITNLPIANDAVTNWNVGSITFNTFNDSGNFVGSGPNVFRANSTFGGSNITSNINFAATGVNARNTQISFDIPAGFVAGGGSIDANLLFGRTGTGADGTSSIFTTTASVPGPLPLLGAASAFGFSRSLRRRIKLAKVA
jgi:hypothetical protein